MSSLALNPKCDICYDIYDQELARAFTAPCGHSICAQCEFRLRISCIKRLILPQCWICMKAFDGPLYRTFALESSIPRFEKQRFQNPYMSNEEILQELVSNPELYLDISIQFYEPRSETPESVWDDMDFSPAYRPNVLSPFESITASMPSYSSSPSIVEEQIQEGNVYARDQSIEHRPVVQTQPSMVPIVPRLIHGPAIVVCSNIIYNVPPGAILFYWEVIRFVTFLTPVFPPYQPFYGPPNYFVMH